LQKDLDATQTSSIDKTSPQVEMFDIGIQTNDLELYNNEDDYFDGDVDCKILSESP